ncbi:TadE/TadG family type IV pilus assembly protein [Modestobacter altitudinis]|uniref:TadE/TadG family type IV pilus assembly protein n=1 Tax=Modestobacter altitudinis TaxID=2213158 RepID=UPI001FEC95E7|nr:TadE/TadG family type IV pilus assembly protein [Modestobacter altitudinis]
MSATHPARPAGRSRFAARLLGERGAAAVEFALVVPLLILLFLGIVEFSQALQVHARLSAAAREGARVVAVGGDLTQAHKAVHDAVDSLDLPDSQITISPDACPSTDPADPLETVTVTITYTQPFAAGLLGKNGVELTSRAVMQCER